MLLTYVQLVRLHQIQYLGYIRIADSLQWIIEAGGSVQQTYVRRTVVIVLIVVIVLNRVLNTNMVSCMSHTVCSHLSPTSVT